MCINVLCLHGCCQNQEIMKDLMKNFIKIGEKYDLNFFFTEAKYDHPIEGKTWYKRLINVEDIGNIHYDVTFVQSTLDDIKEIITQHNISCLIGFSQGANVVDTYLGYMSDHRVKSAVMFSGFSLCDESRKKSLVPIINVISDQDTIVSNKMAPSAYYSIIEIKHDDGHTIPKFEHIYLNICSFIKKNY